MSPAVIVDGLVLGGIAAFDAIGLVLLYRTTRVVNLAQTSMGLVGGVLTGMLVQGQGWSFWWAAPVGIAVGAAIGLATDRVFLRRLQDAPRAVVLVATVGIAQILSGLSVAIPFAFGGPLPTYNLDIGTTFLPAALEVTGAELLVLLAVPVALIGTQAFLHRSRFGLAALALGQEPERARALGIPASAVRSVVWVVAGVLASFSGILSIPAWGFNVAGGFSATLLFFALAPAVMAAFRRLDLAVGTALVLGVVYRLSQDWFDRASSADLTLALAIIAALALRRRQFGRAATAAGASSWRAAVTPRPLPRAQRDNPLVQLSGGILLVAAAAAAIVVPRLLSPSHDVTYAHAMIYGVAALGVGVAWMFAGEVSLGHWGFAVYGAVVAFNVPGPWLLRCIIAAAVIGVAGIPIALATRGGSTLSFAALSLSAAATGPVVALVATDRTIEARVESVAVTSALISLALAAAIVHLRRSKAGIAMVAARDEPQRARWLGADPLMARTAALSISLALAGLAGGLYAATSQLGMPQRSAEALVSFDLLAMTVIGGLGSAVGPLASAVGIHIGGDVLPDAWASLLSGAGILFVVIAAPAGIGRMIAGLRDAAVAMLARRQSDDTHEQVRAA